MSMRRIDILLGLVFFGALIGLGIVTIVLSDFAFGVERHRVELLSDDVGYLRPGDPILLHGMQSGKVEAIQRLPEMVELPLPEGTTGETVPFTVRIIGIMDVDPYAYLRADYEVLIEERGLLGGKLIRIETGDSSRPMTPGPLLAVATEPITQAASGILRDNRENLMRTIENLAQMTEDARGGEGLVGMLLRDGALQVRVRGIVDDIARVTDRLVSGEGTVGRLLTNSEPFDDLRAATSDLRDIAQNVRRGRGTAGKFLTEEDVYGNVLAATADFRSLMAGVREGRGTFGRLATDDTLVRSGEQAVDNLVAITAGLREGHGTIGRLLVDEALYDTLVATLDIDLAGTFEELTRVLDTAIEGRGLLPMLLNDPQLAENFRDIVAQTLGAIEDARETTPVQSLGSFIFGTF